MIQNKNIGDDEPQHIMDSVLKLHNRPDEYHPTCHFNPQIHGFQTQIQYGKNADMVTGVEKFIKKLEHGVPEGVEFNLKNQHND